MGFTTAQTYKIAVVRFNQGGTHLTCLSCHTWLQSVNYLNTIDTALCLWSICNSLPDKATLSWAKLEGLSKTNHKNEENRGWLVVMVETKSCLECLVGNDFFSCWDIYQWIDDAWSCVSRSVFVFFFYQLNWSHKYDENNWSGLKYHKAKAVIYWICIFICDKQ